MQKNYQLIKVISANHWRDYHSIRRRVLWESRGRTDYDDKYKDEYLPDNHPLLLLLSGESIGTARLDDYGNGCGVVRLVAIAENFQRKGHGRILSALLEDYARNQGIKTLYVNAAPEALEFYKKLGWEFYEWNRQELIEIAADCKQMRKFLSHNQQNQD